MVLTIRDENGFTEVFSRWGKTKKITQFSLAKIAWYHFVENELLPANDDKQIEDQQQIKDDEDNFFEVYDDIDLSEDSLE